MAGKTSGRSGKKKPSAVKTKIRTTKTKSVKPFKSKTIKRSAALDKSPAYILAIMVLLIIVIFMLIKNYNTGKKENSALKSETSDAIATKHIDAKKEKETAEKNIKNDVKKETDTNDNSKEKNSKKTISDNKEIAQREFYIFFLKFDRKNEKMSVLPVKRQLSSFSPLQSSLMELIKGPDRNEKRNGFLSAIPEDLKIRNIKVVGRNAVLDLNEAIETDANGEILLTRIDQLVYTATQFDGIDGVIIKVNGREKKFLGGEGLSISGPIQRRGK